MFKKRKGITLIGMPGAGKSTIGKKFASRIGSRFIDLDVYIRDHTQRGHADILAADGNAALISQEEAYTLTLDLSETVFAPGGSIIYSERAMRKIADDTIVIYLEVDTDELRRRLGGGLESRGIVGLREKGLEALHAERDILYRRYADHTIICTGSDEHAIVEKIYEISQH
ncbi:shikimate kinase [Patescibacteria group bacterium]|nr:shikimate kinase [Patescibacteria group bacterium]